MRLDKEVNCPYCRSVKVVKNGKKHNGKQNLLCRSCNKQFQFEYTYIACDHRNRRMIQRMLLRGSGVRGCAAKLGISKETVLRMIIRNAFPVDIEPQQLHHDAVQIDEQWSYVGRKKKKVWLLYAYSARDAEILAFKMGKRNGKTVYNLWFKMKHIPIDFFRTDNREACKVVLPAEIHIVGKRFTKAIEGINTWFRTRIRRLVRRTVCFSKKRLYQYSLIKISYLAQK